MKNLILLIALSFTGLAHAQRVSPSIRVVSTQAVLQCHSNSNSESMISCHQGNEQRLEQVTSWDGQISAPRYQRVSWLSGGDQAPVQSKLVDEVAVVHDKASNTDVPVSRLDFSPNEKNPLPDAAAVAKWLSKIGDQDNQIQRESERYQQAYDQDIANQKAATTRILQRAQRAEIDQKNLVAQGRLEQASYLTALRVPQVLPVKEFTSRERARELSEDPLAYREYSLNEPAQKSLSESVAKLIAAKSYDALIDQAEPLLRQKDSSQQKHAADQFASQFNQEGILKTSAFGLPAGPFESFGFSTKSSSKEGEIVRRVANRFQAEWAKSEGLKNYSSGQVAQFLTGEIYLQMGDQSLGRGDIANGLVSVALAQTLIDGIYGYADGMNESINQILAAAPALKKLALNAAHSFRADPKSAFADAATLLLKTPKILGAVAMNYYRQYDKLKNGNAYDRGEVLGQLTVEALVAVATDGTFSALGKAVKSSEVFGAAVSRSLGPLALDAVGSVVAGTAEKSFEASPLFRQSLLKMGNAEIANEFAGLHSTLLANGSEGTASYIEKLGVSGESFSSAEEVSEIAKNHARILEDIKNVETSSFSGEVTRAISKTGLENGVVVERTAEDVMKIPPANFLKDHRYTIGGDLGESGLYTTTGPDAKSIIMRELDASSDAELLFQTKSVSFQKVLDLTNPQVVKTLGLTTQALIEAENYQITQVLGDVAIRTGYDAILAPSQYSSGLNLVILRSL